MPEVRWRHFVTQALETKAYRRQSGGDGEDNHDTSLHVVFRGTEDTRVIPKGKRNQPKPLPKRALRTAEDLSEVEMDDECAERTNCADRGAEGKANTARRSQAPMAIVD